MEGRRDGGRGQRELITSHLMSGPGTGEGGSSCKNDERSGKEEKGGREEGANERAALLTAHNQ